MSRMTQAAVVMEAEAQLAPLTDESHPLQVAGHFTILKGPHGRVLKPISLTELKFYEQITADTSEHIKELREFLPKFFGCVSHPRTGAQYISIEDLTHNFHWPCVLDLKMGTIQHTSDMDAEKVRYSMEKSLQSTSHSLGIRLTGMKIFNRHTQSYETFDKKYGMKLDREGLMAAFRVFVSDGPEVRWPLLRRFVAELQRLRAVLAEQTAFRFYSTSLLFVFDSQADAATQSAHSALVRMIDFAHSFRLDEEGRRLVPIGHGLVDGAADGIDAGYLLGVDSLLALLRQLLAGAPPPLALCR